MGTQDTVSVCFLTTLLYDAVCTCYIEQQCSVCATDCVMMCCLLCAIRNDGLGCSHTYCKSMDQPGKVGSPARGQLNRKMNLPCPRSCLRISSRETSSAVPCRVSLLISILRLNLVFTYGIPPEFRGGVHLFIYKRHTPSGQSRVYRVTQWRTDGVHCRESAGTEPVNRKIVPNECCLGRSPWTN